MKKLSFLTISLFALANAVFLGLGMECLLQLTGIAFAVSLDGKAVTAQYPRFVPFCCAVGFIALLGVIAIATANIKLAEKLNFSKKSIWLQYVCSFILSLPMIKLFEMLFDFLQKTF